MVGREWCGGAAERALVLSIVLAILRGNCGVNSSNRQVFELTTAVRLEDGLAVGSYFNDAAN